jgi:hypothetical protein
MRGVKKKITHKVNLLHLYSLTPLPPNKLLRLRKMIFYFNLGERLALLIAFGQS